MTRRLLLTTLAVTAAVPVAAADAATPAPYPTVSKIEPLNLGIGDTMTITGRNFVPGVKKNTVVFKRDGKRALFVKADSATRTQLQFKIPESLRKALGKKNGALVPSKFRVRVLARRFAKTYSSKEMSPVIAPRGVEAVRVEEAKRVEAVAQAQAVAIAEAQRTAAPAPAPVPPADCDADGILDPVDPDDDNDLMTDAFELSIGTDPCNKDSDNDGMWDVYEYESAVDLNGRGTLPYPGKQPHPNPLDGTDRNADWDGDGLSTAQEHAAWRKFGNGLPLNYSDGRQATPPRVFADTPARELLDEDGDGELTDDERDIDSDGLGNYYEASGTLLATWWKTTMPFSLETPYFNPYSSVDWLEGDSDGDGKPDGADDQDFDGYSNYEERGRWFINPRFGRRLLVHPFNPCAPDPLSATCSRHMPSNLVEEPYPPFKSYLFRGNVPYWDNDGDKATEPALAPIPLQWPPLSFPSNMPQGTP